MKQFIVIKYTFSDFFKNIFFVTFEGVDCCGKTTLLNILSHHINDNSNYILLPIYRERNHQLIQENIFNNSTHLKEMAIASSIFAFPNGLKMLFPTPLIIPSFAMK